MTVSLLNYLVTQVKSRVRGVGFVISKANLESKRGEVLNHIVRIINDMFEDKDQNKIFGSLSFYFTKYDKETTAEDIKKELEIISFGMQEKFKLNPLQEYLDQSVILSHMIDSSNLFVVQPLEGFSRGLILKSIYTNPGIKRKYFRFGDSLKRQLERLVYSIITKGNEDLSNVLKISSRIENLNNELRAKTSEINKHIQAIISEKDDFAALHQENINGINRRIKEIDDQIEDQKNGHINRKTVIQSEIDHLEVQETNIKMEIKALKEQIKQRNERIANAKNSIEKAKNQKSVNQKKKEEIDDEILKLELEKSSVYWKSRRYNEKEKYGPLKVGNIHFEDKVFKYEGKPYTHIRRYSDKKGKFKIVTDRPEDGQYVCSYTTDRVYYGWCNIEVLVKNKHLPGVAIMYTTFLNNKAELETYDQQFDQAIKELEAIQKTLNDEIEHLNENIANLTQKRKGIKEKKVRVFNT